MASSLPSFYSQLVFIDRIYSLACRADSGVVALEVLERVAEGRPKFIDLEAARKIGVSASEIADGYLKQGSVRVYAIDRIAEVGSTQALSYLVALKQADLGPDDSGRLWPAAVIAVKAARLRRIADRQARIDFLEIVMKEGGFVSRWAAGELCDTGSQRSIPLIHEVIVRVESGQRAEDEFHYCEARIQVLVRDVDRVKALASVLRVDSNAGDTRLQLWAVKQLVSLHRSEADSVLERYRSAIDGLPDLSPQKPRLNVIGESIAPLMAERTRREPKTKQESEGPRFFY